MKKSLLAIFILSIGLVACGGGDSSSTTDPATSTEKPQSMIKKEVDPMLDKGSWAYNFSYFRA